jgi:hypothetical protein
MKATKNCSCCEYWRSRGNKKPGVLIPNGTGKCIRPEGHCNPEIVKGKIGEGLVTTKMVKERKEKVIPL